MVNNKCKIAEKDVLRYAKSLNLNPKLLTEKAISWQIKNNQSRTPTFEELKKYCEDEGSFTKDNTERVTEAVAEEIPGVKLLENKESGYRPRTIANANWSNITIALAEDFTTSGELLTAEAAGAEMTYEEKVGKTGPYTVKTGVKKVQGKYVPVTFKKSIKAKDIANNIIEQINSRSLPKTDIRLNIAGNGIMSIKNFTQEELDDLMTDVLKILLDNGITFSEVRSGGQTGIDEAGIKAAMRLGLNASILAPKGFLYRTKAGVNISDKEKFVRRFNPEYTDDYRREFGSRVVWESPESKRLREEGKKVANTITVNSQGDINSACGAWLYVAKEYGIDNRKTIHTDEWDIEVNSTNSRAEEWNRRYLEAMRIMHRNYLNIEGRSEEKRDKAKFHRLQVKQVDESDAVFVISEIVNPGEKNSPLYEGDKRIYENTSKIPVVAGSSGIAVQLAIMAGKPVHVFDSKDNKWKTWKNGKFQEESTPKLTSNPLLLGRRKDRSKSGYVEQLGKDNFHAILDVFRATFKYRINGIENRSMQGLDISEMGEARQAVAGLAKEYTPTNEGLSVNKTNPMTKLCLDFSAQERRMRAEMLARSFSDTVSTLISEELDNMNETLKMAYDKKEEALDKLKKATKDNKKELKSEYKKATKAYSDWLGYYDNLQNEDKSRKAVINHYTLGGVFQRMKEDLAMIIEYTEDSEIKNKYQKVLDNFDLLIQDALEKVQSFENFRVIPYKSKGSDKFSGEATDTQAEQAKIADEFGDDELGSRTTGNDGWSFKIRFVDPRLSLSMKTKKVLNNIPMILPENAPTDPNNPERILYDDLGNVRYMNGEYAHAMLINDLSTMIDADDFSVPQRDAKGNIVSYTFPALEKFATKYTWAKEVIEALKNDPELIGAFFHDFNKAFINYAKMDANGVSMPLNQPIAVDSSLDALTRNYTNAIELSNDCIYDTAGKIKRDKAAELLIKLKNSNSNIDNVSLDHDIVYNEDGTFNVFSDAYEAAEVLSNILRAMGFETSPLFFARNLKSLLEVSEEGASKYHSLFNTVNTVLSMAADPNQRGKGKRTFNDNENYLMFFARDLKKIAEIVGEVSELDNVQSFRDGENTRYSYSAPNYIINMVKKIKSNSRRLNYLQEEFGYDEMFYDKKNGKWRNKWLADLADDSENGPGRYLRRFLDLSEVIAVTKVNQFGEEENVPYADWSPEQTYDVLFNQYFSRRTDEGEIQIANYNMPIFSDSPVCMFITGRRYISNSEQSFKEQLLPLYNEVVKQEMRRIKKVSERIKAREAGDKSQGLAEIQSYDKRGTEFCFFPELNTIEMREIYPNTNDDRRLFKDVAQELIENKDMDTLNDIIDKAMEVILDRLFNNFMSTINLNHVTERLENWGVTKASKEELASKEGLGIRYSRTIAALEEYFWNSTFAATQIVQMTTSDLAFYKSAVDFQKRFKEVYASGNRLNTNSRYGRKFENTIYVKDQIMTASRYDNAKKSLERAVEEKRLTEAHKDWILEELKKINVADAQAFRNPASFRAILDMMGKWNDEMEESYNRMIHNQWNEKDFAIIWQTLKPFMFTNVKTKDGLGKEIRVPHQNKNSEFLVLAFYDMIAAGSGESPFLRGIGRFFHKHKEIDLIQFESAVKAGGQGIINLGNNMDKVRKILYGEDTSFIEDAKELLGDKEFKKASDDEKLKVVLDHMLEIGEMTQEEYNSYFDYLAMDDSEIEASLEANIKLNGEYDMEKGIFNDEVIHQLPYSDYMIAQPTPEHLMDIEDATAGSQFRNLILANITDPKFSITLKTNGKDIKLNKQEMMYLYRAAITDNLLDSYFECTGMFGDIHDLQRHIFNAIQGNPKYGTDIVEALQIVKVQDPRNPKKTMEVFNLPLDLPTISNQVQELLTSVFKNRVTKQKIKGGNCIQVACVGLSRKLNILRDADNNILGAECMMPAWSKKFYAPFMVDKTYSNGEHYQEIDIERMEKEAPDLLKMIGYRIPTENKYSMLPLIVKGFLPQQNGSSIMLPADITLIAGSDFDVDKMFLRIPAFEINDDGIPEKISYDVFDDNGVLDTSMMSKQQRDNMMIDIEYAVLISTEGSEQVFKPGNFNNLKKEARILRILNDNRLLEKYVRQYTDEIADLVDKKGNIIPVETILDNPELILEIIRDEDVSTDDLDKFLDKEGGTINALTPTSYVYFHTQNMTGSALIGLYANGSSIHAKAQETYLRIYDNEFTINGKQLGSMHEILNQDGQYIQDVIAEFQAASVDNAKDPVLADLGQNMYTAGTTLFMIRAGMNIEEVALMFNVVKNPLPFNSLLNKMGAEFGKDYMQSLPKVTETSSEEMLKAAMYISKHKDFFDALNLNLDNDEEKIEYNKIRQTMTSTEVYNMLNALYDVYSVYNHISKLKSALKPANDIMKADSPNNAIATGFPGAIRQRREVDRVEVLMDDSKFPFRGLDDWASETKREFISNGLVSPKMDRSELRRVLLAERLPAMQAFYSLGIELPIYSMGDKLIQGSEFLGLGSRNVPGKLGSIMMNNSEGNLSETQIKDFYREFMQFVMTTTDLFGKDFDVKRQYYLTEFPMKALKLKREIKELKDNPVVSRLKFNIRNGAEASNITYERSGKLTPDMKSSIRRSLNMLLYSDNPEVVKFGKDLFMYSYYYNGFNYGPNSFGTFFDATFWNCFPEVVNKLRTFKYEDDYYSALCNEFFDQYLANHADDSKDTVIKEYVSRDAAPIYNNDGSVTLRAGNCWNRFNFGYNDYIRIKGDYGYRLYMLDRSTIKKNFLPADTPINYLPVPIFDEYQPVYNANSTAKKMYEVYFNNRKRIIAEKAEAEKNLKGKAATNVNPNASAPDEQASPSADERMQQVASTVEGIDTDLKKRNSFDKLVANSEEDMDVSGVDKVLQSQIEEEQEDMRRQSKVSEYDAKFNNAGEIKTNISESMNRTIRMSEEALREDAGVKDDSHFNNLVSKVEAKNKEQGKC